MDSDPGKINNIDNIKQIKNIKNGSVIRSFDYKLKTEWIFSQATLLWKELFFFPHIWSYDQEPMTVI